MKSEAKLEGGLLGSGTEVVAEWVWCLGVSLICEPKGPEKVRLWFTRAIQARDGAKAGKIRRRGKQRSRPAKEAPTSKLRLVCLVVWGDSVPVLISAF